MSTTPVLAAEGINTFYGRSHILRNVSFHVNAGETVTLLGRNGMGKTTLLRTLMGLVHPASGRIALNGADVTSQRASVRARSGLALVPEGRGIFPNLTVDENLTFASRKGGWDLQRVYSVFPRLAERKHHWGNELSGGEQQMLSIGRALMTNPSIILLDEATEGLAPKLRDEIWNTVKQITASGIAAIIVDKNLTDLLALADRNTIMAKGEIVFDGTSAALRADEALIHRHLGV
ncbi:MAG: ABC transporter ATP-binding protein [Xanthobacteraceae bacterium]|mgnify:CR=1 FL=1|nr:ABC transporter ATP-binding protein [Xanthobacteraceae bacterium]QYK45190.1 MAG: ABC transporter ATP-binding protein [Xanthobacteraceae bacterium]